MNLVKMESNDKVREAVIDSIHQASDIGQWMAVVWHVKDGRIVMSRCSTWEFPTGDFDSAIKMLRDFCNEEKMSNAETMPAPLPSAEKFFGLPKDKPEHEYNRTMEGEENIKKIRMPLIDKIKPACSCNEKGVVKGNIDRADREEGQ